MEVTKQDCSEYGCVVLCEDDVVFLYCVGRQGLLDQNYRLINTILWLGFAAPLKVHLFSRETR